MTVRSKFPAAKSIAGGAAKTVFVAGNLNLPE